MLSTLASFHRYAKFAQNSRSVFIRLAPQSGPSISSLAHRKVHSNFKPLTAAPNRSLKMAPNDLITKATAYVRTYMAHYDPSHDYRHICRVVRLAQQLHDAESTASAVPLDHNVVHLAALLHDVGDRKYLREGEDPTTMVRDALLGFGADEELAVRVQAICLGVSYSAEMADPERVRRLLVQYPELAVVQDADRLDAIGAVGIGRCFGFGGAKDRPMDHTMRHFDDKLIRIEGKMKTETGKKMARERSERLETFKSWWKEETAIPEEN